MMKIILVLTFFSFFSCELHEQTSNVTSPSIDQVFDLDVSDQMFVAVIDNDYFLLKELIEKQAALINVTNEQGQLLLTEAVKSDKRFLAHLLVSNGASITLVDSNNNSALNLISKFSGDDLEEWQSILEGEDFSHEYLNELSLELVSESSLDNEKDDLLKLDLYLELGASSNAQNSRNSLLMIAASKGLNETVRFLCERDETDVNLKIGRFTVFGLVKRLTRRNPSLKETLEILKGYGAK